MLFSALVCYIRIHLKKLENDMMKPLLFVENYREICHSRGQYINFYSQAGKSHNSSLAEALGLLNL